jgi:hypothetical protein
LILEIECRFGAGMDVQFLVDVLFARLFPDAERAEDGVEQIFRDGLVHAPVNQDATG